MGRVVSLILAQRDTLITTKTGQEAISTIAKGDQVLAYNELLKTTGWYTVTAIWVHKDPIIINLTIDDELIETTPEHPFYTDDDRWVAAKDLQVGEHIRRANGSYGTLQSLKAVVQPQWMYNLTIDQAHTYFVGIDRWLVHNDCFPGIIEDIKASNNTLDFGKLQGKSIYKELILQKALQGYHASVDLDLAIQAIEEGWTIESVSELRALLGGSYDYYQSLPRIDNVFRKAIHGYNAPQDHFWQQTVEAIGDWWDYTKP